ncbi:MAG TPA: alpha-ketoglutarate-dependent dioxygenase AlkB [Caulobacteraceae bacterium]|jgi:alkylated DNA repair protein (DNA oxidative demethylase)|nr:alpha-ketoglutarate-dependent dioxygenase AlkB [Caulobacteraceae bacterium]
MTNVDPGQALPGTDGFRLWPAVLDDGRQRALADEALELAACEAPFMRHLTPSGARMSVEMTSFGEAGWISDRGGYRYEPRHPVTGRPWPPIPRTLLELWDALAQAKGPPDACLVNLYRGPARMGLHQDRDEADFSYPVLSVSLGDTAVFRIGGLSRRASTRSLRLASGDVCRLAGEGRLAFHGIDRVIEGSSSVVCGGGRLNFTLRRAGP